jgi:aspartate/methionine/tyrosine aminotransferase
LSYGRSTASALSFAPDAIVVNSFSKYFSMTGWRIGWIVVPENLVRAVERLAQNLFISPPAISQVAAMAAMTAQAKSELDGHIQSYRTNRDVLTKALRSGGIEHIAPADGAFYLYANVETYCGDSRDFAARLLSETGVAATPGWDFDPADGGKWMRFSTAGRVADVAEAAAALNSWLLRQTRR